MHSDDTSSPRIYMVLVVNKGNTFTLLTLVWIYISIVEKCRIRQSIPLNKVVAYKQAPLKFTKKKEHFRLGFLFTN
ncbi:hypothetical protein L6452_20755 [Arctium lappa]|uniref:Uncharacterized protein n=1 Tax=Arctium lappa TaxID=4217 RepID=A0ACB9BD28_ARCLA|nr:hypothetical protein L6452_20755 [Arctium lappa]